MLTNRDRPQQQCDGISRREWLRVGSVGLGGLSLPLLLQAAASRGNDANHPVRAKSVIYIFLSGGLAQHDSFDMKPDASDKIRGEFSPIATQTPGLEICEHLPLLAARSNRWAVVRSLTHPYNEHFEAHSVMLSGRSSIPRGFNRGRASDNDWPSITAVAGAVTRSNGNLPPAVVLPEKLIQKTGFTIAGQLAGLMGSRRDPWIVEASPFRADKSFGAYPEYGFSHLKEAAVNTENVPFQAPNLSLPEGIGPGRFGKRLEMLKVLEDQRRGLEQAAAAGKFDRYRQAAVSLLADPKVQRAFDVTRADDKTQDRYGRNSFGWSLLMARRLIESGVNLIQVNLGNYNSWDTHGANFPKLKNFLLPPTDRALSALIDDLDERGMLDDTMIVMAGEFGRTPKISRLPRFYKFAGRDHWGGAQSVFFAGGGVQGGTVIGATDKIGAYPSADPQSPENMAATIYQSLGLPPTAAWHDDLGRPHQIYHGEPIAGLLG